MSEHLFPVIEQYLEPGIYLMCSGCRRFSRAGVITITSGNEVTCEECS